MPPSEQPISDMLDVWAVRAWLLAFVLGIFSSGAFVFCLIWISLIFLPFWYFIRYIAEDE
jgi:hypothetical protein